MALSVARAAPGGSARRWHLPPPCCVSGCVSGWRCPRCSRCRATSPRPSACAARGRSASIGCCSPLARSAWNSGPPASWSSMKRWANEPSLISASTGLMLSFTCCVDHPRAGDVVAVLRGVGDRPALLGDAALVHQVDDQLELVQALEVGDLGLVAGLGEHLEAVHHQLRGAAAEHGLLAEQVGLGLLGERRPDAAGAQAADRLGVGQGERPRPCRRRPSRPRRAPGTPRPSTYSRRTRWPGPFGAIMTTSTPSGGVM